jgi:hypothetical protein
MEDENEVETVDAFTGGVFVTVVGSPPFTLPHGFGAARGVNGG